MNFFSKKPGISQPKAIRALEDRGNARIIRLKGSMDITTVGEIQEFGSKMRAQKGYEFKNLLVDFTEVSYMDSSAVAVLVQTLRDYKQLHHTIGIVNISPELRSVLEITRVDKLVRFYETEAQAVKELDA